jgi:hypothetical protein
VGARFAVTSPINTIAGGEVRFSLRILPDDAVQATVAFEYKAIGKGWVRLQAYTEAEYAAPAYVNPNGASLALWAGGGVNGFVMYTVQLPDAAKSAVTKFRWRQVLEAMQVRHTAMAQWRIVTAGFSGGRSLTRIVARTHIYTYAGKEWDLSIVQGPFSVAPCQTLNVTIRNFFIDVRGGSSGWNARRKKMTDSTAWNPLPILSSVQPALRCLDPSLSPGKGLHHQRSSSLCD